MTYHHLRCNNGCKYRGASQWVCFHPNAIGSDGDGVGLTEYEKDHVLRLGCASHSELIQRIKDEQETERKKVVESYKKLSECIKKHWGERHEAPTYQYNKLVRILDEFENELMQPIQEKPQTKHVDEQWFSEQINKYGFREKGLIGTGYEGNILFCIVNGKEYGIVIDHIFEFEEIKKEKKHDDRT